MRQSASLAIGIEKKTKFVVVEMGAAKKWRHRLSRKIAKPSIGIITCCASASGKF